MFKSENSHFILHNVNYSVYILVYVDDIVITDSSSNIISSVVQGLFAQFSLEDLGPSQYFLVVEVLPSVDGIILSQTKYIQDLLFESGMLDCNGVSTPMSTSANLQIDPTAHSLDINLYRRIVGHLQYLSFMRPDLS